MFFRNVLAISAVLIATVLAFLPVLGNGFVNWDDPSTLEHNTHLAATGVVTWAFTTTEMGHYQPLAWLIWSQMKAMFGLDPIAFHGLSLLGHLLNVALVYLVCVRLATVAGLEETRLRTAAVVAAFAFAIHPIRVEAVAWASAFPYVLSLTFVLSALLAYLRYVGQVGRVGRVGDSTDSVFSPTRPTRPTSLWLWLAIGSYAVSQLTRASAVAFPLVLLLIDAYPLRRGPRWSNLLKEKSPFFAVALVAALAESHARELATLEEVGVGARFAMAAAAPFMYLWKTLLPIGLSPLDPLPIEPGVKWIQLAFGLAALGAVSVIVWRSRSERPVLAVGWAAYLLLLGPAMGLTPSGQQVTADRYMYVPGVVVSLLVGAVAASAAVARRRLAIAVAIAGIGAAAALGVATWRQAAWWRDSVVLWTRAAELDPLNDIATYNLAIALAEAGREDEAIARYEQTLRLVPDHDFARHNLNLIRATRGIARVQRGEYVEAVADLRVALDATVRMKPNTARAQDGSKHEIALANALAFAFAQTDRHAEARAVLTEALRRYPEDHELAHNLARLLATSPDSAVRDGTLAVRLAVAVRQQTAGRDPRVLDTLAAAYATNGQFELARETAAEAAELARRRGDFEMARAIEVQARRYGQRRP